MQKVYKWLTPLIAVGVAVFTALFVLSLYEHNQPVEVKSLDLQTQNSLPNYKKNWLDSFSKIDIEQHNYPLGEVLIKFDLQKESIKKLPLYRLLANISDPYELFCLEQEVKLTKLHYILNKNSSNIELFIYADDKNRLENLLLRLKEYDIKAQIEPNTKET
ncbi:MAG: hypothetical protein WC144_02970 [Sulfurimonas sp.]|jgi:hypothetical protein|nr:hypothetical protein [Sulfurimonadaceae bacterium]